MERSHLQLSEKLMLFTEYKASTLNEEYLVQVGN